MTLEEQLGDCSSGWRGDGGLAQGGGGQSDCVLGRFEGGFVDGLDPGCARVSVEENSRGWASAAELEAAGGAGWEESFPR